MKILINKKIITLRNKLKLKKQREKSERKKELKKSHGTINNKKHHETYYMNSKNITWNISYIARPRLRLAHPQGPVPSECHPHRAFMGTARAPSRFISYETPSLLLKYPNVTLATNKKR
jgi:hypothetical protein